ncbi:MAG TPA: heme-degrading domain-containing protein [Cellvibrio sp.]
MNSEILSTLLAQEDELQLHYFNNQTAWELGSLIKAAADQSAAPIAIEIYAFEHVLFSYFMPGTNKDNHDWIKRKRQSVMRFSHSSYYTGQYNATKNRNFETIPYLDPKEYCAHGGSFPIRLKNSGLVGAVTVSGLAQEVDHQMVIDALRIIVAKQAGETAK